MKITITKLANANGSLLGFAEVKFGGITTRGWRILKQSNGTLRVVLPVITEKKSDGKIFYRELLALPPELQQEAIVTILAEWQKEKKDVHNQ